MVQVQPVQLYRGAGTLSKSVPPAPP
ncbi:hypothetical protein CABS03_04389 [Colletotrichum abscissum]|uniref:Uncharacterized protein n=2 Tax=Colletotrichum acutatum species complex TaxID=2707335 RepID=A0A9Q0B2W6_9PEZI|nr:hypothetical protein CABS02_04568 [Colletotrichum abscissum]KAK0378829.1 hypothetical protein CLIM01_03800 [Colletotrichum limetticola]